MNTFVDILMGTALITAIVALWVIIIGIIKLIFDL